MHIGIFSDVHDNIPNLRKAREVFDQASVELAFFCGDLVSPFTFKFLADWDIPIKAVYGNNEGDKWGIVRRFKKYDLSHIEYPKSGLAWNLDIDGKSIASFHGNDDTLTRSLTESDEFDVVFTGHTHEPHIKTIGKTLWVNPGSVVGISEDPNITEATVAIYNSKEHNAKLITL